MSLQRRRRVELYFVLYLVALVLLLPEKPVGQGSTATLPSDLRFDLQPERVRLECKLVRDTAGRLRLMSLDSLNVIHYSGEPDDIQVFARVEDVSSGQVLNIEKGRSNGGLFELVPQPQRQAILFTWRPNLADATPRMLRVTLTASAKPPVLGGPNASDNDRLPAGLRINGATQFVLATTVADETGSQLQFGNTTTDTIRIVQQNGSALLGSFWMEAARDMITATPMQPWSMRLSIGGADPLRDLQGMPQVRSSSSDNPVERYLDTAARTIVVRGKAPRNGSYTVSATALRKDGQVAETSFTIQAVPLPSINIADQMFPGVEYVIDPMLPNVQDAEAVILDGQREVVSVRAGKLRFTPHAADTGKTYQFVRLIGGQRAEVPQNIRIRSFPAPEIRDVKDFGTNDKKKVIVKFYGDRNKDRPTLDVVEGNARTPRKLFGNIHAADANESPTITWIEEFEVSRKDAGKPFSFVLVAKSPSGLSSMPWRE